MRRAASVLCASLLLPAGVAAAGETPLSGERSFTSEVAFERTWWVEGKDKWGNVALEKGKTYSVLARVWTDPAGTKQAELTFRSPGGRVAGQAYGTVEKDAERPLADIPDSAKGVPWSFHAGGGKTWIAFGTAHQRLILLRVYKHQPTPPEGHRTYSSELPGPPHP